MSFLQNLFLLINVAVTQWETQQCWWWREARLEGQAPGMWPRVLRSNTAEVKILLRSNTAEVKILLISKYFLGQYSLGVKQAQRLKYFWSQFFTEGKIEMQLLIKACKLFNLWPQVQSRKDVICFFWCRFWIILMVERGGVQKVGPPQVCWLQNSMPFRVSKRLIIISQVVGWSQVGEPWGEPTFRVFSTSQVPFVTFPMSQVLNK